ncbi:MAG: hypothetical protein SOZ00_00745 [Tidjanibacter sp.]|nr:hypothetical protein [Tidjanibacter sp.]
MLKSIVIKATRVPLIIIGVCSLFATGCGTVTEHPIDDSRVDVRIVRSGYSASRSLSTVRQISYDTADNTGIWIRPMGSIGEWQTENDFTELDGEVLHSFEWSQSLCVTCAEIYAVSPYNSSNQLIPEAFVGSRSTANSAGFHYRVGAGSGDLAVGSAVAENGSAFLALRPVLSRVGFSVSVCVDGKERRFDVVEKGAKATFDLRDGNTLRIDRVALRGNFYAEGIVDLSTGEWAVPDRACRRFDSANYIGTTTPQAVSVGSFELSSEEFASFEQMGGGQSRSSVQLNDENNYIYLIPQKPAEVVLEVEYTVVNPSGCAIGFAEQFSADNLEFVAGESRLFNIGFDFSTISFSPNTVTWH